MNERKRPTRIREMMAVFVLGSMLPLTMGGCPEFRDEAVDAFETATRGLVDAALDLYFDQFRSDRGF